MKKYLVLILAGILCVMLAASGCTSSSSKTLPTPAVTAAATAESLAPATPAPESLSWTGTWNTTWLEKDGNHTVSVMSLTQKGQDVTGNYSFTYPGEGTYAGSLNATVQGSALAGTYAESDDDTGYFVFDLSENRNAFTGRWVHAANRSELANSTRFWNGVRE